MAPSDHRVQPQPPYSWRAQSEFPLGQEQLQSPASSPAQLQSPTSDSDLMGSTACKLAEPDVNVELSWRPYLMPWPIREPSQWPGLNVEPRQLGYPTMKPSQQHHRTAPNLRAWAVASPD